MTHRRHTREGDGDGPDRRGAVDGRDDHLLAAHLHAAHAAQRFHRPAGGLGPAVDVGDDEVVADAALELGRRALGDQPAAVDDADPVGQFVRLFQVLGGEEDGHAELGVEPADLLPHPGPAHRVQAAGRLVEEQHLGVVDQRGGQVEPALHPARVGADRPPERVADVDELAQVGQPVADLGPRQPVQPALQLQQFDAGLLGVERGLLERHPDPQADLLRLGGHVVPGHDRPPAGGGKQGAQHPDGR